MVSVVADLDVGRRPETPGVVRRVVAAVGPQAAGVGLLLAVWIFAAEVLYADKRAVPAPWTVASQMVSDLGFYRPHIVQTLSEAGWGYLFGNLIAFALGLVFVLVPVIERLAFRLVIAVYCLPLIAVAPILQIVLSDFTAKSVLAAQAVFFTTLVGVTLGLRSADPQSLDVVHCAGGGAVSQFMKVRLRSAVPGAISGLKVAAPAALLGAVIGEFLGGSRGLGVAMILSQQSFNVERTWGLAMVLTMLAAGGYLVTERIGRWLAPWSATSTMSLGSAAPANTSGSFLSRAGVVVVSVVGSLCFVVAAWYALIAVFDLEPFFAKTPLDVWNYLVTDSDAGVNRAELSSELLITLRNAGLGYLAGTVGAVVLAVGVVSFRWVEQAVMPVAIALRSIPLVAMTPLIALIFGRGLVCVLVISGIVTFFPSLVHLVDGLRSAPAPAFDLAHAFGLGPIRTLWKVRAPYAVPALFAAARIAAPLAILGAILAEWLATGKGVGNLMVLAGAQSRYDTLWASVAAITAAAVAIYGCAAVAEAAVLRRFLGRS